MTDSQHRFPLIHVGFHKTASKFLQRSVFCSEELGFYAPWPVGEGQELDVFARPKDSIFDIEAASALFSSGMSEASARGLLPVITNEDLCGYPVRGEYYGVEVAHRLHQVFPQAKILIGIREQQSMLFSMYQQYIRQYGSLRIEQYLGTGDAPTGAEPLCRLEHLEYHSLVGLYQSLFGATNVLVLPLELLRHNHQGYLSALLEFTDSQGPMPSDTTVVNAGWSGVTLSMRRRINSLLPIPAPGSTPGLAHRSANHLCYAMERIAPDWANDRIEARWKQAIYETVAGRYNRSNKELEGMTGLRLGLYGYVGGETDAET